MSVKYRIRLKDDRIVGPFTTEEVGELFLKAHIQGDELCQQFPIGDWKNIRTFPSIAQLISKIEKKNLTVTKFEQPSDEAIKDASTPPPEEKTQSGVKTFKEFKFGKDVKIDVDYKALERKYRTEMGAEYEDDGMEKTRIVHRPNKVQDVDKTVVIPSKAAMPTKETTEARKIRIETEKETKRKKAEAAAANIPTHEELVNEATEFVNIASILPKINAQLSVSEVELDKQARIEEMNERKRIKELELQAKLEAEKQANEDEEEEDEEYEEEEVVAADGSVEPPKKKKKKKGMSIVAILAFLGVFYFMLQPEDKPKAAGPLFIDVKFPITQEFEDKQGAKAALEAGRKLYAKGNYVSRSLASGFFLDSLQKQFSNNEALGELILTYSELLDDTKDPKLAANTIYKLITLAENKMLTDLNVVTGTAMFYDKIGKHQTGVQIIKNYLRAKGKLSSKLLAYYLELLINSGELVDAKKTYDKLVALPKKPYEVYYYLSHFNDVNEEPAEGRTIIEEGLKYYPNSALLLLKQADYLFKDQDQKKYEQVLKKAYLGNVEGSPYYTAKLLHHMGILYALQGKEVEAAKYFKRSLDLKETEELRSMLSGLEISGNKISASIIKESKVLDLLKRAKVEYKNKNIEAAFSLSIEAADAAPEYIPAIIFQTQMQMKRGLFDAAINTLQQAIAANPTNYTLRKNLINAYIKSSKLELAQKAIYELSQTKFLLTSEYAQLLGDLYLAHENGALAIKWFTESLNRDPLNDYSMAQLARIYVRIKKFNEARAKLTKALLLDPKNPEYLALNAEIIYEQDNTDTAIGYLRDSISEVGEEPRLIAQIATFYYKSGQIKEFQSYYKRIQSMPKKDEAFYQFLIYASKLEEKSEDVINYSKELLKLNPGNLKVRLELAEFLFELKRYSEAITELEEIKTKLNSYPKVHYLLAKIYIATMDMKKAQEMAAKELELNPTLDTSYFIVGEVYRIQKEYREAILQYEKAISLNPKSVDALMAMAWIRLSQNYASEAIELYGRALREDKTNPEIHKQLGYAYKAAGQRSLAKEKFEDYLKLSPGAQDKEQIESQIRALQ